MLISRTFSHVSNKSLFTQFLVLVCNSSARIFSVLSATSFYIISVATFYSVQLKRQNEGEKHNNAIKHAIFITGH